MKRRAAFTLIELVVIIMILGILAGVAAPKLLKTSGSATDNGLKQTLSIVRDAIELYNAANPTTPLTCTGDGDDFKTSLIPYIRGPFPKSPVGTKENKVKGVAASPPVADGATGWMYSTLDGSFICNSSANSSTGGAYSTF
jgi:general secretion pathway protein G